MIKFEIVSFTLFICAVIHTFLVHKFNSLAHELKKNKSKRSFHLFTIELLHFMGEVEIVFGLWAIPLAFAMSYYLSWDYTIHYLENLNYTEPLFVVVIMCVASSYPILQFSEKSMAFIAQAFGNSVKSWWWILLTCGPLLGAFITEPAAMTLSALLLIKYFFALKPQRSFAYATLGLLFTNISVGGIITDYAAPLVLMVRKPWNWDTSYMVQHFGYKAILGVFLCNFLYFQFFRNHFADLEARWKKNVNKQENSKPLPFWIIIIHLIFLIWIVVHSHHPVIFIGTFLLFLGFMSATQPFQQKLELRGPLLVGLFLAGLVVHGNLQGWWIESFLSSFSEHMLLILSMALTSFNDNAIITYLATLIPSLSEAKKYAIVSGAAAGGGLTVIANAPNPAGYSLLNRFFQDGISALFLFLAALPAALIMAGIFYLLWL